MQNYLLVGNGLNRCLSTGVSWGDLLKTVAEKYHVSYNPNIVMPMEFERIVNEILSRDLTKNPNTFINDVKSEISNLIKDESLKSDAIHYKLNKMKIDGLLTTNYDLLLEKVFDKNYVYNGSKTNKYLFEPTGNVNEKLFYHLHGIVSNPSSLCLGYEHYMGMVQNLRGELNTKKRNISTEMAIKRILCNEEPSKNIWGELFYTSNIAIIGLGLTDCESDLWWLITHRASLYYSDYCNLRSDRILKNKIVYYDVLDEIKKGNPAKEQERKNSEIEKKNRHQLLRGEHVDVKTFCLGKDCCSYTEAYNLMIEDICKNGISS